MVRPLACDTKAIIYNVAEYFRKRKADKDSFEFKTDANIGKIVAEATGYSYKTVRRIVMEANLSIENSGQVNFSSPKKPKGKKKKIVNDSDLDVIRRKINIYYEVEKKLPSIRKLLESLREEGVLNCGREYLRILLHEMGYQLNKCNSQVESDSDSKSSSVNDEIEENQDSLNLKTE